MSESQEKQGAASAPDLDELARRLLDLWQDQLAAVAANPDLATQAARLMAAMPLPGMWLNQMGQMGASAAAGTAQPGGTNPGGINPGAQQTDMAKVWAKMVEDWKAQDWWKGVPGERRAEPAAEPAATEKDGPAPARTETGAAAAATASQPRGGDLDELSRRLAGIEQRLHELAEKPKPVRKPRAKTAAPKPRRTRAADPADGAGGADGGTAG